MAKKSNIKRNTKGKAKGKKNVTPYKHYDDKEKMIKNKFGTIEEKEDGIHITIDKDAYDEWIKEMKKLEEEFDKLTDEEIDKIWDNL